MKFEKIEIAIAFGKRRRGRKPKVDPPTQLSLIPDDRLTEIEPQRLNVSIEFIQKLHDLEDPRG